MWQLAGFATVAESGQTGSAKQDRPHDALGEFFHWCSFSCSRLDRLQQMLWQPRRNGFGGGLQIRQRHHLSFGPVQMIGGVMRLPIGSLSRLVGEFWNRFTCWLSHKSRATCGACLWLKLPVSTGLTYAA